VVRGRTDGSRGPPEGGGGEVGRGKGKLSFGGLEEKGEGRVRFSSERV